MGGNRCPKCEKPYLVYKGKDDGAWCTNCGFNEPHLSFEEYHERFRKDDDFYKQRIHIPGPEE